MEIEVGEYVRTKKGRIGKFDYISQDMLNKSIEYYVIKVGIHPTIKSLYRTIDVEEQDIKKHSHNIIDLIEFGDIIEIYINEECSMTLKFIISSQEMIDEIKEDKNLLKYLISILTHEQYENNCYKVVK